MAASNSNITGVHFSLIFFVMLSIILGVVSYLKVNEASEMRSKVKTAEDSTRQAKRDYETMADAAGGVKVAIGVDAPLLNDDDKKVFLAEMKKFHEKAISLYGEEDWSNTMGLKKPGNLLQTIQILMVAYDRIRDIKDKQIADIKQLKNDADRKLVAANKDMARLQNDLQNLNALVTKMGNDHKTAIQEKQAEIQKQDDKFIALKAKMDEDREAHLLIVKKLQGDYDITIRTVAVLRDQMDEFQRLSFERADGVIRVVDHRTNLVWINLGSKDHLKVRTTFSVYNRANHGVGRGGEEIKGAIEVMRITGPHTAEARVLSAELTNGIRSGDPIYNPAWTPGHSESFALAGYIDLDGDGKNDRDVLRRAILTAGATISNEVTDEGKRVGTGLTTDDKFLVLGKILDPELGVTEKEKRIRLKIAQEYGKLKKEAQEKGVRIVRLSDFKSYMGIHIDQRLWRPGEGSPWKLKSGAHSTTINETIGNRTSSGQVTKSIGKKPTDIYSRGRKFRQLKQAVSPGQTTKSFGNK